MNYTVLIDNGHGKNTPGKRSPLLPDGSRFYEWEYTRKLAGKLIPLLEANGIKTVNLVPDDNDVSLTERANRANRYKAGHPLEKCIFISLHGNAAGSGAWMNAKGWSIWTTKGQNNSDKLAECIWKDTEKAFPDRTIRSDKSDGDHDYEKNFTVIYAAQMPAVLIEAWFYDNKEDLDFMKTDAAQERTAHAIFLGVLQYIQMMG